MLTRWLDRSNIGQILAPDENASKVRPVTENDEGRAPFWQFLAPDPKFASKPPPPPGSFPPNMQDGANNTLVACVHCHQWTPISSSTSPSPQTPRPLSATRNNTPGVMFQTPSPIQNNSQLNDVQQRVLSAAQDTAKSSTKPKKYRDAGEFILRSCANTNTLKVQIVNKIGKQLKRDPTLLFARSCAMGVSCPDGKTPLMACALTNQVEAAKVVLEAAEWAAQTVEDPQPYKELHLQRDLEGKCALSIASEAGSVELVQLLLPLYDIPKPTSDGVPAASLTSPVPVDLLGRTPLGNAMLSPRAKARSNRKILEQALFSPLDPSIVGEFKPLSERMHVFSSLQMAYGYADMPGKRIEMEDAICAETWSTAVGQEYSLLGVCDGHSDGGQVSAFVATNVSTVLRQTMEGLAADDTSSVEYWSAVWTRTCLELDEKLKAEKLDGGSTAVLALITKDLIVVANVGDSRCVLIQTAPPAQETPVVETVTDQNSDSSAEQASGEASEAPTLRDETTPQVAAGEEATNMDDVTDQLAQMQISTGTKTGATIVTPLSFDHKPELPQEAARVEKAGLTVATNTYNMNGKEVTYHKIAKSDTDMIATSRSFGDFDYKENTTLEPEEQAVSCVADVQVHKRDPERDMYLVLACDGIWDVMENEQLMDFVLTEVQNKTAAGSEAVLPDVGDALVRKCLDLGSTDNMSAVLVSLQPEAQQIMSPTSSDLPPPKTLQFGASPTK